MEEDKDINRAFGVLWSLIFGGGGVYFAIKAFDLLFIHTSLLSSNPPFIAFAVALGFVFSIFDIFLMGIFLYCMIFDMVSDSEDKDENI